MLPYWLLFGWFTLGALFHDERQQNRVSPLLLFAAFLATMMVGLRFRVGGDWAVYRDFYERVASLSLGKALWEPTSDPAYSLINWIGGQLGPGIWFVNLICGAILLWGIMTLAVRQPNPWLVFVIAVPYLIIVVGMGYTRQSAAIGLSLIAIMAFVDGKFRKFVAFIILAALFHKSAIILVPIVGLSVSKNRVVTAAFIAATALLLYYFLVSGRIEVLSRNYLGAELESEGAGIRVAMNVLPALIFLLAPRRFGFDDQERKLWRNLALASLAAVVALMLVQSSTVVDRLALYFAAIQLVILGRMPWAFDPEGRARAVLVLLVMIYSAAVEFVWLNYATYARLWLPYRIFPLA